MQDGQLLLTAFDKLWKKYCNRLQHWQQEASEDAVHKFRICCRRLLAIIELLQAIAPQKALGKLRKNLKSQLDKLDELRDTQVMLLEVSSDSDKLPELAIFQRYLRLNEQRLLAKVPSNFQDLNSKTLHKLQHQALKTLAKEFGNTNLKPLILATIDNTYNIALERYRAIDPNRTDTLHRHRIAVKKLRYMLASAQVLLPELPEDHFKHLQTYLTYLGEIQNSCVLLTSLNRFFAHQLPDSLQKHYQQRHQAMLNNYMTQRSEILQFWRQHKNDPFPWAQ
jgi:CHAD domain-containing protein